MTLALATRPAATDIARRTGIIAAYLRVSHAEDDGRSFEEQQATQREAIRRLIERNGTTGPVVEFVDWDKSADPAKEHKRAGFAAMLRAVERGEVAVVYASSLDRLYRGLATFFRLTETCKAHNVHVVTDREGDLQGDGSPMAVGYSQMTAVFGGIELAQAKARANSRVARQRAEGKQLGAKPFGQRKGEDVEAVIAAFAESGSYNGAARLLNARAVPLRRGSTWESITVSRIIRREDMAGHLPAGIELPHDPRPRARTISRHVFAGLLRCPHDGTILTGSNRTDRSGPSVGYFCRLGRTRPHESPWSVGEHFIRDWAEAATTEVLGRPGTGSPVVIDAEGTVVIGEPEDVDTAVEIDRQRARRARYAHLFGEDAITLTEWERVRDDVDTILLRLAGAQRASATWRMTFDWGLPDSDLNIRLRDVLHSIRLNARMRPIGGVWLRRPILHDGSGVFALDEATLEEVGQPDPRAVQTEHGWFLPSEVE